MIAKSRSKYTQYSPITAKGRPYFCSSPMFLFRSSTCTSIGSHRSQILETFLARYRHECRARYRRIHGKRIKFVFYEELFLVLEKGEFHFANDPREFAPISSLLVSSRRASSSARFYSFSRGTPVRNLLISRKTAGRKKKRYRLEGNL